MNTSKSLWHFVAFATVCLAPASARAAMDHGVHLMLAGNTLAQAGREPSASDRREAEKLLAAARSAVKQGEFDKAESLIATVDQMNLTFGIFHFGDTPRKLRADLKAARKTGAKPPQRPSEKFTPQMPAQDAKVAEQQPVKKKASRVPTEVVDPREEAPLALPQTAGMKPLLPPTAAAMTPESELPAATRLPSPTAPTVGGVDGNRRQSDYQLLMARRALAVGDLRRASAALEESRKLGVNYGFHDDSPDKVETAIRNYQQVSEAIKGRQDEAARRQMADLLMDQSQQLLRWKDYDEAERLAQHA